jgi:predicted HTH domain antitoxin
MTETMTFEVSQDLLASLKIGIQDLAQEIRVMAAITYFQEKKLSLGKAADLAGCNRLNFMDLLARKGIVIFDYDESIVDSELRGVAQLSKGAVLLSAMPPR